MGQDLEVNGFTRSGTTYTYTAIKLAFPQLEVMHSHDYLDLGWRAKNNKPSIACIRNPIDTISSTLLHRNLENKKEEFIKNVINEYIKHLKVINLIKNNIIISNFDDIIKDFNPLLKKVSEKYNYESVTISKEDIITDIPKYEGDENLRFSRLPRDNNNLKEYAKLRLNDPVYSVLLQQAKNLYLSIKE